MNHNKNRINPRQVILHIPHSSTYIPEQYRKLFYLNKKQLDQEVLKMTDAYTDELFEIPEIPAENRLVFPYSRLICDVERFRDDQMESMARKGMGVCYTATSSLGPLKPVSEEHRREMLRLYDTHHAELTAVADRIIDRYGLGVLIDCHSFASEQLPYEATNESPGSIGNIRPEICIGTDPEWHTVIWLQNCVTEGFLKRGYSVALNYPFSGTLVPMKHYHRDRRLLSVMIEVNRKLYMNEKTGAKTDRFETVKTDIKDVVAEICAASNTETGW